MDLFQPDRHETVATAPWNEAAVRQTIERLANTSHFRGETVSSDAQ